MCAYEGECGRIGFGQLERSETIKVSTIYVGATVEKCLDRKQIATHHSLVQRDSAEAVS